MLGWLLQGGLGITTSALQSLQTLNHLFLNQAQPAVAFSVEATRFEHGVPLPHPPGTSLGKLAASDTEWWSPASMYDVLDRIICRLSGRECPAEVKSKPLVYDSDNDSEPRQVTQSQLELDSLCFYFWVRLVKDACRKQRKEISTLICRYSM